MKFILLIPLLLNILFASQTCTNGKFVSFNTFKTLAGKPNSYIFFDNYDNNAVRWFIVFNNDAKQSCRTLDLNQNAKQSLYRYLGSLTAMCQRDKAVLNSYMKLFQIVSIQDYIWLNIAIKNHLNLKEKLIKAMYNTWSIRNYKTFEEKGIILKGSGKGIFY